MTTKEIQNVFSRETSLTEILLSLMIDNAEYSDFIQEITNITHEVIDDDSDSE